MLSAVGTKLFKRIICEQAHGKTGGEAQEWVRSMLATCGRGGNAQAVRDEILNIMHRNNIGEKRGTWMEVGHCNLLSFQICTKIENCMEVLASAMR